MPRLRYCVIHLPGMLGQHSSCRERRRREEKGQMGSAHPVVHSGVASARRILVAANSRQWDQAAHHPTVGGGDTRPTRLQGVGFALLALARTPIPNRAPSSPPQTRPCPTPPTCSADHQTSKDHGRAEAQRGASTCPAFRGPPVFGPVLLAGRLCISVPSHVSHGLHVPRLVRRDVLVRLDLPAGLPGTVQRVLQLQCDDVPGG